MRPPVFCVVILAPMVLCWAAALGDCSSRQSGEHTISANLMEGDVVYVRGFPWCADRDVAIPPQGLRQNILCTAHNSALSPTDGAGGDLFRALWSLRKAAGRRLETRKKPKLLRVTHLDGHLVARWMLKTVINGGIARTGRQWWPPGSWVRRAFGLEPFTATSGMYLLPSDWTGTDPSMWEVHIELLAKGQRPIGGIVGLDQIRFAICAEEYDVPEGWIRLRCLQDSERFDRYQKIIFDW